MNVLIIGSKGFIGSNFKQYLIQKNFLNILDHNRKDSINNLLKKLKSSDLILHFGGENRSKNKVNFFKNNYELTKLVAINAKEKTQIIYTSTIKINEKNPYGLSKKKAEKILKKYKNKNNYKLSILRLPNVFGRWSKPNYNSVVSTYCYNAARKKSSLINDKKKELKLLYIDDLMEQLIDIIKSKKNKLYPTIKNINKIKLVDLHKKIYSLNQKRIDLDTDLVKTKFDKQIYSTYLSFLPEKKFLISFKKNEDKRGNFSELLKSKKNGQVSFCTINPGETRGNHFHFTKVERFFALSGKGKIIYKNINNKKEKIYAFDYKKPLIFETIPGWSHKLVNTSKSVAIFVLWTNEIFDIKKPDTYFYNI